MGKMPDQIFESLVPERLRDRGVKVGRMYRSSPRGLTVNGKIFAFMSKGQLVVKLSKERVEQPSASGVGQPFDSGGGRVMKEWMAVDAGASRRWRSLMTEAEEFVAASTRATRRRAP